VKKPKKASKSRPPAGLQVWYLALGLVVVLLNLNTLPNGFTLDDRTLIVEDARVKDLGRLPELLSSGYREGRENSLYRPLTNLSLALNYAVTGPSAGGFHAVNLLLHLGACLIFFKLGILVLRQTSAAFAAALLFAVHPAHVEAVANVVGRAEVLAAALVGASLLALWNAVPSAGRSVRLGVAGGIFYLLALFTKESAVTATGLWVLLLWFSMESDVPAATRFGAVLRDRRLWMLVSLTGVYLIVRYAVLGTLAPAVQPEITYAENPLAFVDSHTRILTAVTVLARYVKLLAWPFTLSCDYSFRAVPLVTTPADPAFIVSAAVLAGITAAAVIFRKRKPVYLFALLFFLASIATVANVVVPIGATLAERFLYLPSIAFCWAIAQAARDLGAWGQTEESPVTLVRRPGFAALALVVVLPWGVRSFLRNADWRDDGTLFESAVAVFPENAKARVLLADHRFARGDYRGAEDGYRRALRIYPEYAGAAINLASSLDAQARYAEALKLLESFSGRSGKFEPARLREVGRARMGLEQWEAAAAAYEQSLELFEADPLAHRNLGGLYIQYLGKSENGKQHLRRSLELSPNQDGAPLLRQAIGDGPR
jgi:protein O-mannosyl-transferase